MALLASTDPVSYPRLRTIIEILKPGPPMYSCLERGHNVHVVQRLLQPYVKMEISVKIAITMSHAASNAQSAQFVQFDY